jgi:hypothetical protein
MSTTSFLPQLRMSADKQETFLKLAILAAASIAGLA